MDLLLGGSSTSACGRGAISDRLMTMSKAVAPLSSGMKNGAWYSAAAEPCSNDADYEKFSSDAARAHVTVRCLDCCIVGFLNCTKNGFSYCGRIFCCLVKDMMLLC